ncbi:hypothetical protein C2S51_036852 [Perilla frutescens var. frutescens]|nr:hypothetical protein C2S51_036852 [Perilla frutescens var. frutescens]
MDDLVKMILLVFSVVVVLVGTCSAKVEVMEELSSRQEVLNWAGYGQDKLSTVVIHGNLLCHHAFNHRLSTHPYPVSGASVAVFCRAYGKKMKSWARGSTDSYGQFIIDLPSHLHAIPNLEKICLVRVLHLPKSCPCRYAFTGTHKAIKLTSIGEGVRTYTTNNIRLMKKPSSRKHVRGGAKTDQKISVL